MVEDSLASTRLVGEQNKMKGAKQALPSILVIAVVVGIWWAAVVATRVLKPKFAVLWAGGFNFLAAFIVGTAVAKTFAKGLIDPSVPR